MPARKEIVDSLIHKLVSRKLTVFTVASIGMFVGNIESPDWVIIASVYIGSETVITVVKEFYKIRNSNGYNHTGENQDTPPEHQG